MQAQGKTQTKTYVQNKVFGYLELPDVMSFLYHIGVEEKGNIRIGKKLVLVPLTKIITPGDVDTLLRYYNIDKINVRRDPDIVNKKYIPVTKEVFDKLIDMIENVYRILDSGGGYDFKNAATRTMEDAMVEIIKEYGVGEVPSSARTYYVCIDQLDDDCGYSDEIYNILYDIVVDYMKEKGIKVEVEVSDDESDEEINEKAFEKLKEIDKDLAEMYEKVWYINGMEGNVCEVYPEIFKCNNN